MNLFTQLRQEWHSATPQQLMAAPATALKAVDEARASALAEVLGVRTVADLAAQPMVDWVWRTFRRFRAGAQRDLPEDAPQHLDDAWLQRSCGDWLASPLSSLKGLDAAQQERLEAALGWVTIRQVASDAVFEAAREISRVVTGKPVAPDRDVTRPAPDYFSGGTQRFLAKAREAAGLPARPAVPPVPPAPPPAPAAAPTAAPRQAAPELPTEGELAPAVAASLHAGPGSRMPPVALEPHRDYTDTGSYIARGGGTRGWLDNALVARNERPNGYRYSEALDVERFRRSGLEQQVRAGNRGADGKEVHQQVRWSHGADQAPSAGVCLNLSLTGARLRLSHLVADGDSLCVTWVHRDELTGVEAPLLALAGQVAWCQPVSATHHSSRYDCGLTFGEMSADVAERLALLLTDRVDELLQRGEPEPLPPG